MIAFIKGIFQDQLIRGLKMLEDLHSSNINSEVDNDFLSRTIQDLSALVTEIRAVIDSGDLEIDALGKNNIIKYNTFNESLLTIELFRYLVIINYGEPEVYFKRKVGRIYKEVNCLQKQPIITTISNSENYYWALPTYDIIAVPVGEERSLLNLPDLFHEMGHLIFNQFEQYLIGDIEKSLITFYNQEIQRVDLEQRPIHLKEFYRQKLSNWLSSWVMEYTCDLIATYLVGPAFAWTNLKITTLSSGKSRVYEGSASHPSDESRMRAIFSMLKKMGHTEELEQINTSWKNFLHATNNPVPANYQHMFPQAIIDKLVEYVWEGCKAIDLSVYQDQVAKFGNPVSKMLNDAWTVTLTQPEKYADWEKNTINSI